MSRSTPTSDRTLDAGGETPSGEVTNAMTSDTFLREVAHISGIRALPDLAPGERIGRFLVESKLGEGGMGAVYAADDPTLGRKIALKVLVRADSDERRKRFLREARAASAVTHPSIAAVYDAGEDEGRAFIAMELVRGEPLRARIAVKTLAVAEAVRIARDITIGLAVAHDAGIIHRDVKPENVMITGDGAIKILDFGLAKLIDQPVVVLSDNKQMLHMSTTEEGRILGTPAYMSPEQAHGQKIDPRTDLFSLGLVLYEMLTQERPFRRSTLEAGMSALLFEEPLPPSSLNAAVPAEIDRVVLRCLAKEPQDRFESARDLGAALDAWIASAQPPSDVKTPRRAPQRDGAMVDEGDVIAGKYRVERVIGRGGMGVVVAAMHVQLGQRVAIKFLLSNATPEIMARFVREARAVVRLKSEHVTRVHDVGELEDGAPYMVMEHLEGSDLAAVLRARGALPVADVIGYVLEACEAIAEAHAAGIIHRDLKPANLFLAKAAGGSTIVKVLDFGISKEPFSGAEPEIVLTRTSALLGSPAYMSPEQMRSARDVDVRSDIWSLGVILYELLAGARPFDAMTLFELVLKMNEEGPRPMSLFRSDVPPGLEAVIRRCIEKDAGKRWGSVAELARALAPFGNAEASASAQQIGRVLGDSADSLRTMAMADTERAQASMSPEPATRAAVTQAPAAQAKDAPPSTTRTSKASPKGSRLLPFVLLGGVLSIGALFFWGKTRPPSAPPPLPITTASAASGAASSPPIASSTSIPLSSSIPSSPPSLSSAPAARASTSPLAPPSSGVARGQDKRPLPSARPSATAKPGEFSINF